ncbi:MAG: hypothetical protein BWK79_02695 [Beggiatoa sp. IS2]|nr:MAG: hypothetical protein BWK79_02695 [Beggiatoa sp. IS2]
MLSRFIKPKWQHRDPEVRKTAVEKIEDLTVLTEIAQHDEVASVRRAAIRRISDFNLLDSITRHDAENEIREFALQRLRQLLCGQSAQGPSLNERLAWFNQVTADSELLEYVAANGQEFELRLAAVAKVTREGFLGDRAINDTVSKVRLSAAEKLTQPSTLERVYKATRNRDKRVSRLVREKLDALIEETERPERLQIQSESLCTRLESLRRHQYLTWEQRAEEAGRLQEQWQNLVSETGTHEVSHDLRLRFTKAKEDFTQELTDYQQRQTAAQQREQSLVPLRAAKQDVCNCTESLLTELQALPRLNFDEDTALNQRIDALQNQWAEIQKLDETTAEQYWQARFNRALQAVHKQQKVLQMFHKLATSLETLVATAETLNIGSQIVKSENIQELRAKWAGVTLPSKLPSFFDGLSQRFENVLQTLETKIKQQIQERETSIQTLKELLTQIEVAIDQGELHTATPLEQKAHAILERVTKLPGGQVSKLKNLEQHFQSLSTKINHLRSWERWGDNRERENLCVQVENLIGRTGEDPEETARLIRDAQKAWKNLGSHYPQKLWERFSHACHTVFLPCQAYFAEKSQERETHLAQRQAICEQLEGFAAASEWENLDWKEFHRTVRELQKKWHVVGPTTRKVRKGLRTRFDVALKIINKRLGEECQRNFQQRNDLLTKVKLAQQIPDLNQALAEVKRLQAQWQITVPGKRSEERDLWKIWKEECDKVFDRRKQQQGEEDVQRQSHLEQKTAICEQIEALANLTGEACKTIPAQLKNLQAEWKNIGPLPRGAIRVAEKHFANARKQAEIHYQASLLAEQRQQAELLKQKALLCEELELSTVEELPVRLQVAQETWATLPKLVEVRLETAIEQRFVRAGALENNVRELTSEEFKAKETLCIRMEIVASVDSPPEALPARMAYQVSRLSEAMSGGDPGSTDKLTQARAIEREWYLGRVDSRVQALEQRFQRALTTFYAPKDVS